MTDQIRPVPTYTIKAAASLTGLPASTLRYYETIGIIEPIQRGASSKQRVYTEEDLNAITAISCLSATGLSIEDMRAYMTNRAKGAQAADEQIGLLAAQKQRLLNKERRLNIQQQYLNLKIEYWQAAARHDETKTTKIGQEAAALAKQLMKQGETA